MRIAVIGGGASGITFAINRKKNHPEDEIVVFEHLDKVLKKILSTGNGKCNIGNKLDISYLSDEQLVSDILRKYDYTYQNDFLNSLNIKTKLVGDLAYPISESAVTVRNEFLKAIDKYKIQVLTNANIEDYRLENDKVVLLNQIFDKLVIATGGKSSPKLGSDGSFINILNKHNYKLKELQPALCPIYTKEKTKLLDGTRVKAVVRLYGNDQLVFEEIGEVLFKERGLSGIVIFNASRVIADDLNKQYKFEIDLIPSANHEDLQEFLKKNTSSELLESYLHPNLARYIESLNIPDKQLVDTIKSFKFTFDGLYGFDNSQISVGGIKFKDLTNKLESKIEPNVYFLGELLDYSAPCGGHNLMWAIGSALYLSDNI